MTSPIDWAMAYADAVDRMKETGFDSETIARHNRDLVAGYVAVSHDFPGKKHWCAVVAPETRFSTIKSAMGL